MKKKRIKLSVTIDNDIYQEFMEKIEKEHLNKSKLFDKLISKWLDEI